MCSEEKIQMARADKAFVFRKTSFYITTSITLVLILTGVIVSFTTLKLKAVEFDKRLYDTEEKIEPIDEIYFNLRHLFIENDWKWVEGKE